MAQKGKLAKTEIFCLILTALFSLLAAAVFLHGTADRGGVTVTEWKNEDISQSLPQKININTADEETLQQLPGVGPVLARRIVAWREENGSYQIPEDLLAVEGIGLATLEGLRDMIVTEEEP